MRYVAAVMAGAFFIAAPAHAYLDGATASIALQAIIGFFAAWGLYSRRAKDWVMGLFSKEDKQTEE